MPGLPRPWNLSRGKTLPTSVGRVRRRVRAAACRRPPDLLLVAHRPRHLEHVALVRNRRVLERRRERHWHVARADSSNGTVEIVERALSDHRRNLSGDAVPEVPLVYDNAARRLAN